ncbi:MAG: SAM-dependent chlorinase/fluorinase [Bacteroidia bacterium]|nr:SAM-dependent chlorinase/fluorinase [Bacteroidia bacterium]MBP9688440.1 SAM-dependent chlorinase/fluorinase [Bacteroidia bacterium]
MKIITLTSDYGLNTYYAAALKARLLGVIPNAVIVDISHNLPSYDLIQGAFLLQSCLNDFTLETIHIVAIDTNLLVHKDILIGKKNNHWVIAADNGFLSKVFDSWDVIYKVKSNLFSVDDLSPEKNIFTQIAAYIVNDTNINEYAEVAVPNIIVDNLKPVILHDQIRASIIHVDGYNNAITNLNKSTFEDWVGDTKYTVYYRKIESLEKISTNYANVKNGDGVAVFNDVGWLEVAINKGQGTSLLGLKLGDQIIIEKKND